MFQPQQIQIIEGPTIVAPDRSRACLVPGCTCKDARIVSFRRAAFFAAVARRSGQTANRSIAADPDWPIPTLEGAQ